MQLVVFLHMEDISKLKKGVPANSTIATVITRALKLRHAAGANGANVAIVCDEFEGRELLDYARVQCPDLVKKIKEAYALAALRTAA